MTKLLSDKYSPGELVTPGVITGGLAPAHGLSSEFRALPVEQGNIEVIFFSSELTWKGYIIQEKY